MGPYGHRRPAKCLASKEELPNTENSLDLLGATAVPAAQLLVTIPRGSQRWWELPLHSPPLGRNRSPALSLGGSLTAPLRQHYMTTGTGIRRSPRTALKGPPGMESTPVTPPTEQQPAGMPQSHHGAEGSFQFHT